MSSSNHEAELALKAYWEDKKILDAYLKGEPHSVIPVAALIQKSKIFDSDSSSSGPLKVLDEASGTGIVASQLFELAKEKKREIEVVCGDLSSSMIDFVKERAEKEKWGNVEAKVIDAQDNKLPSDHFDHVFISQGVMVMPRPFDALKESIRVTKPGGTFTFSTIQASGWVSSLAQAVSRVPGLKPVPEGFPKHLWEKTGKWHDPNWVHQNLVKEFSSSLDKDKISVTSFLHAQTSQGPEFVDVAGDLLVPLVLEEQPLTDEEKVEKKALVMKALKEIVGEGIITTNMEAVFVTVVKRQ